MVVAGKSRTSLAQDTRLSFVASQKGTEDMYR